jgi:hypothetical protein
MPVGAISCGNPLERIVAYSDKEHPEVPGNGVMETCLPCYPSREQFTEIEGGLNGSTQHSARTHIHWKQKLKALARVRSAGTLPWLGLATPAKQIDSSG